MTGRERIAAASVLKELEKPLSSTADGSEGGILQLLNSTYMQELHINQWFLMQKRLQVECSFV